MELEFMMLCR